MFLMSYKVIACVSISQVHLQAKTHLFWIWNVLERVYHVTNEYGWLKLYDYSFA